MSGRVTVDLEHLLLLRAKARGFSLLPRQPVGSLLSGLHASRLRGRGLAFEELRRYHPGDDVRTIDWKATARLRSPHVRVFSEERERPVLFVVDQRSPMFFGSRRAMKSVAAAEFAALGAWRALDVGDRAGGLVLGDDELVEIRPRRDSTQVLRLFHAIVRLNQRLAEARSDRDPGPRRSIDDALQAALRLADHDHLVVVISDLDGATEFTGRLASRINAHNDVLVVAVYDPLGIQLRGQPGMRASDRGRVWEIPEDPRFGPRFQTTFEEVLQHWTSLFRGLRVPVFPLSTAAPVADQIHEVLGHHAR